MNLTTFGYHLKEGRQYVLEVYTGPRLTTSLVCRHVGYTTSIIVYSPKDQTDIDAAVAMCEKQKPKYQAVIDAKGCTCIKIPKGLA